jgi:hypothetical protein
MNEASRMAATSKIQDVVSKINALRKLTRESGFITTRTQGQILQSLQPDEMTAVAEILAAQPEVKRG